MKLSESLGVDRKSLTEASSFTENENALGKAYALMSFIQASFQNKVITPSHTMLDAKPLKMGISLHISLHQNEPTGSMS
jgi:hypothetical protein